MAVVLLNSTRTCFQKYGVFRGRSVRPEFWYLVLFFFVAYSEMIAADDSIGGDLPELSFGEFVLPGYCKLEAGVAMLLDRPVMALPTSAVMARRLHDTGRRDWWAWLSVLPPPAVGSFALVPWLAQTLDDAENTYDPVSVSV